MVKSIRQRTNKYSDEKDNAFLLLAFCFSNSVSRSGCSIYQTDFFQYAYQLGRDGDNSWPNRRHATAQMLRQEAPDVMGVQEAMQDQLYYIDTECPRYARVGEDRDGGAEGGETMAVFYLRDRFELLDSGTFWISETPDNVSRGWDAACNRTVTWVELRDKSSGKEFFYFNTHLDHQGKIAREEGVKLIVTKIRQIAGKKAAVILGGDLNTSIDNPHLKPLTRLMASARDTAAETDQKEHSMVSDRLRTRLFSIIFSTAAG